MSQKPLTSLLFTAIIIYELNINQVCTGSILPEVTYPGIGHFKLTDFFHPIWRPFSLLPHSPEQIDTKFLLHTRKNFNDPQVLKQGDLYSLKKSFFNHDKPTKFMVHGFLDNQYTAEWMRQLKNEFLLADDYNVFIVDWSNGNGIPYIRATANTRVVGAVIALFIYDLKSIFGLDLNKVHILGHSLGSHIAGYAGEKFNGSLGRITGLDPAGPYFGGVPNPNAKLDPTDAQFVDVIHSDAEHLLTSLGFGMYETNGHLDFYPNGGKNQPGCIKQKFTSAVFNGIADGMKKLIFCSHVKSLDFYLASINYKQNKVIAYQCPDYQSFLNGECMDCGDGSKCAIFGLEAEKSSKFKDKTEGTRFFFSTISTFPYLQNQFAIQIKMASNSTEDQRLNNQGKVNVILHGEKNDEKVTLNEKERIFELGQNYTFIKNLATNLGIIKKVTLNWNNNLDRNEYKMWIDSITVVPLSSDNVFNREQHLNEIKTICRSNRNEGLINEKDYEFTIYCK